MKAAGRPEYSMDHEFDIFDDAGELEIPTMRGSANLDVQDYQGYDGRSSILDDGLDEDVPSTPGRHPGAAAATDVEGTSDFDMLDVEGGMDAPGMKQTTFGSSPWGPGSSMGYRPYSQQRAGMELRALGGDDHMPAPKPVEKDSMYMEEEVIDTFAVEKTGPWKDEWHGGRNQEPSNADIDPMTLYDRTSYEYDDSSQDTIGSGIFGMEEGATWRPRDGMFAHKFALPAYIGSEDELGVQQSEMWDSTAGEWRVTQPSAGGVTLARKVPGLKPAYSPFGADGGPAPTQMRPEVTGPRSHIEAFSRKAAKCIVDEARAHRPENRGKFLKRALDSLGPGGSKKVKAAADRLVKLGYRPDIALEDAAAHLVMHAATRDLTEKKKKRTSMLPRLDKMSRVVTTKANDLRKAASDHLMPLTQNGAVLRKDLGSLYQSPAARGMGEVTDEAASNGTKTALFTPKKVMAAAGIGFVGYLLFSNRKKIAKNIKKIVSNR